MANVSSSNGLKKYPKLRFPGFSDPWKLTALRTVLKERKEYSEKDGNCIFHFYGIGDVGSYRRRGGR